MSVKVFLSLILGLVAAGVLAESKTENKVVWSIDYGLTAMEQVSSIKDFLGTLGYTDIDKWAVESSPLSSHLGLNLHHGDWTFGGSYQSKHVHNIDVTLNANLLIERAHSSISWWSVQGERRFRTNGKTHPFVAAGVSHATLSGYAKVLDFEARSNVEDTEPFVRIGLSRQVMKARLRIDYTKRFTDNEDASNLFRLALRYPLGGSSLP